jgi:hypothetical protein
MARSPKSLTREILKPLVDPGLRATDYEIKKRTKVFAEPEIKDRVEPEVAAPEVAAPEAAAPEVAPDVTEQVQVDTETPAGLAEPAAVEPEAVADLPVEPEVPPVPVKPEPASEEEMQRMLDQRSKEIGEPRQVPSPTPAQKEAGIVEGPFNTRIYDNDGLAATIQSFADKAPELKTRTVQSLYDDAQQRGVPVDVLKAVFSGTKLESAVGDSELAVRMAGLMTLHDESAKRLDDLMLKMQNNQLDDEGQLELREAIAQHDIIYGDMVNAKRDVARTMNVFKNIKGREGVPLTEVRAALDSLGGADNLRSFAEKYNDLKKEGRAAQNKMLQRGVVGRIYDAAVYAAQSVLLMNPTTHVYNIAANTLMLGVADPLERTLAVPIGMARQRMAKIFGKDYDADRATMDDVAATGLALMGGMRDGWVLAGRALRDSQGAKQEANRNPFRAEYLFGREIARAKGDGLFKTGLAASVDALGTVYSVPFKALGASDELIGGYAARIELLRQAGRVGQKTYDDVMLNGGTHDEALAAAQEAATRLATERPADVQQNIDGFRKAITMTSDPDFSLATGRALWKTQKFLNHPALKPLTMFSRTITNIASEGAARSPLFMLSPRFHAEWVKGGASRDMAISRVALGTSMMTAGYFLAANDWLTGSGPSSTEERNNLRELGWQPFSLSFGTDTFSYDAINRLRGLLGEDQVTIGKGQFEGQVFVSLSRLEPFNMPFLLSAAMADYGKFAMYDPDENIGLEMSASAAAALSEFSTNIPVMTTFGELMKIAGSKATDTGDKFVDIINGVTKAYGNFALNATPGVNLANSALAAMFERLIDPSISNVGVNEDQAQWLYESMGIDNPRKSVAIGAFLESYNRLRSRVPVLSEGVPPKLDPLTAEPIGANKELAYRFSPAYVSAGKQDKLREMMAVLNHGVGEPNLLIHGVRLPVEVENRYKKLYAQEIKINGLNMSQRLMKDIEEKIGYYEKREQTANIGVMHGMIDSVVAEYRDIARQRMFGTMVQDRFDPELYALNNVPLDGRRYGLPGNEIEYPDLAVRMRRNANQKKQYGTQ